MDDQRRVLEAALDLESVTRGESRANALVFTQVLFAPLDVLAYGDAEALDELVVAHEPRNVFGSMLGRLGWEVAESLVQLEAHRAREFRIALDRLVEEWIEILAVALEAEDEGLVIDAGTDEGHVFERHADKLGETSCRSLDGVAEPHDAIDRRSFIHGPAQHRHRVRVVEEPGVGALFVHDGGDSQHHRDRAQRAEDAADAERVTDRLPYAVSKRHVKVDQRRLVPPDLDHVDDIVGALERGPPVERR